MYNRVNLTKRTLLPLLTVQEVHTNVMYFGCFTIFNFDNISCNMYMAYYLVTDTESVSKKDGIIETLKNDWIWVYNC